MAKDFCDILEIKNATQAVQNLDDDERSMYYIGRQGEVNVINEPGLYALIFKSRKPEAKQFTRCCYKDTDQAIRNYVDDENKLTRKFDESARYSMYSAS